MFGFRTTSPPYNATSLTPSPHYPAVVNLARITGVGKKTTSPVSGREVVSTPVKSFFWQSRHFSRGVSGSKRPYVDIGDRRVIQRVCTGCGKTELEVVSRHLPLPSTTQPVKPTPIKPGSWFGCLIGLHDYVYSYELESFKQRK